MSDDEIRELRKLCDEATPGPWSTSRKNDAKRVVTTDGRVVADWIYTRDLGFIAAARTAVPKLLDELEAAQSRVARLCVLLREQYDLAHNVKDAQTRIEGAEGSEGCDDRCRKALAALAEVEGE